jgi:5'-nucleotidase/UDP-sugar diphosphatase
MPSQRGIGFRTWTIVSAVAVALGLSASACSDSDSGKPSPSGSGGEGGGTGTPQKLVILHTNDLHSHLMGHSPEGDYTPASTGDDDTIGGVARLATAIGAARARAETAHTPVLLLDAGDFTMGTLFELLSTRQAAELSVMQTLGYDATTLGNHEFDWTPLGLAGILQAATAQGVHVPIVASNLKFSATDDRDDGLEALAKAGVIQSKLVKTVGTLKVGFFGLLGLDAAQVTPQAAPVTFDLISTAARRMVTELRDVDGVDVVIALSHSGIKSDGSGEDKELAMAVPGIDVIVSGHTHDSLSEPVHVGNTLIVTAGAYGRYLGELEITVTPSAASGEQPEIAVDDYTLREIDDSIEGDADLQSSVEGYVDDVDELLSSSGLSYRQVVAQTETDLALPEYAEAPVGNLVADAYRTVSSALDSDDPPVIGVDANGQIRSPLLQGKSGEVWLADLFRVVPLGTGPDQKPGFPLVSFYLNASDIRSGLELGAAKNVLSNDYFLQVSGLKVEYDMTKPLFGRVASLSLVTESGVQPMDLEDTETCYKIVTTNYVAGLLGVVERFTSGLLAVNAKDSDCRTLVDPTTRFIDADPKTAGTQELKNWQALLHYVSAFPDSDGDDVPNIPLVYGLSQERIVEQ